MENNSIAVSTTVGARSGLAAWPARQVFALCAGLALLVATITLSVQWTRTGDYRVLFANLSDRDGGAVIAALSQMNIPYKFAEVGGAISIPADQLHQARMKLASQGLPRGGAVGFELMESQKFGASQFQERLNYQRGLEGELTRSIQALSSIQSARVHLALPAQNGFFRDRQKPSASVLLSLHPGRQIDRAQIAGIVHLVASSVTELTPKQVSVVDQDGKLLSEDPQAPATGLDPSQLAYLRRIESDYVQRILEIVQPIVGNGNVRAQVSAEIDFTQSEATAEEYKPNQGKEPQTVRSQQTSESAADAGGAPAQGVPGALSNQPPGAASAPINGAAQNVQASTGANSAGAGAGSRREATTNFEVDKTIKVVRNPSGMIKRLTAAVIVNHRRSVDKAGKVTMSALTEKEIEGINALVRETIGWSKDRGDTLNVMNTPFVVEEAPPKPPEPPWWKQQENIAMAKEASKTGGLILLGLLTIFGVIRPAIKAIPKVPSASELAANRERVNETIGDELTLPGVNQPQVLQMARENPAAVASVVRTWVNKNG